MPVLVVIAAALVLVALERLPGLRFAPLRLRRPWLGSDLAYFASGIGFSLLTSGFVLWLSGQLGRLGVPRLAEMPLPSPLAFVVSLLLLDLGQYVTHRLLHAIEPLWEFHKAHHSSRTLDWLANSRSHVVENALRRYVAPLGVIALGMPRMPTVVAGTLLSVWALFIHSNVRVDLRPLERLVTTPRVHRIHHMPATTQRNFGAFLTVWDRIAGTFVAFDPAPGDTLGVPGEVETYPQGFLAQLVEPIRRIVGRRGRSRAERATSA
jgi:sterol desaturase/sphingolipid hydroxylase (fatty acid hydroxylase superfamily)